MLDFKDGDELREHLMALRVMRRQRKASIHRPRRNRLTPAQREEILAKTDGRCHICGGEIEGSWQADHVIAQSAGGSSQTNSYLAAHPVCNNYRWDYVPQEFEIILKLGVWARTQVERDTIVGRAISMGFAAYEARRVSRRKSS